MKKLLMATVPIVFGALYFGPAQAGIVDSFCGPLAEGGCGDGPKVFLDNAHGVTTVTGNVGANNSGPGVVITSDKNMMLTVTLDAGGGFANITPGGHANFFNGIDFSIPGYEFTSLIFSVQMEAKIAELTDSFTIDGFRGLLLNRVADQIQSETAKTDTDREFSITALAGAFDDVDIFSTTGFNEIKHIKVGGLCQLLDNGTCVPTVIDAAEPATFALLGFAMLGTIAAASRRR